MKKTIALLLAMVLMLTGLTAVSVGAETTTAVNLTFTLDEGETAETEADRALMADKPDATEGFSDEGGYEGGAVVYTAKADSGTAKPRFFNGPQVKFEKNKIYTISFRVKASVDGVTTWLAPADIYTIDLNGKHQTYGGEPIAPTLSTAWKTITFTVAIKDFQEGSTGAKQGFVESTCMMGNFGNYTEGTTVYIDDFTVTVTSNETAALDLSGTKKTVLSVGETSKLVAKVTDAFGNAVESPTVTYTSDNTEVASVSADGTVTAHKNGVAIITAKSGNVQKSIVMMVGTKGATLNFDSAPPASIAAGNSTYQYAASVDTTTYREGDGSWKIVNRSDVSGLKSDATVLLRDLSGKSAQTFAYWFYYDGTNGSKGRIHLRNGSTMYNGGYFDSKYDTTAKGGRLSLLMYLNSTAGKYTNNQWDNGLQSLKSNSLNRSIGWHQVVLVNTYKTVTVYLDGQVWMSGNNTGAGLDIAQVDFVMEGGARFDSVVLDDFVAVDTGTAIPQHTVRVNAEGGNGAVKHGLVTVSRYSYVDADGKTQNRYYNTFKAHDQSNETLTLVPDEGYEAKVKVDGQQVPVQDNTVTISNITADKTVDVSFEKIITEPSISGTDANYIMTEEYGDNKDFAYVAYYKFVVPASYQVKNYGMYFNEKDVETEPLKLLAEGKNEDNMFGIRVFGAAVQEGKSYTFRGFAEMNDGTTVTTDTVTK